MSESSQQDDQSGSLKQWEQVRSLIEHEDELTHQRLTWLFNSQALLFAAFALIFQALIKKDVDPKYIETSKAVLAVITAIGIFTCVFIQMAVHAAVKHSDDLAKKWREHNEDWKPHPPIRGEFKQRPYEVLHSRFLPLVFIGSWFALLSIIVATLINPQAIFWLLSGVLLTYGYFWLFGPGKKAGNAESGR